MCELDQFIHDLIELGELPCEFVLGHLILRRTATQQDSRGNNTAKKDQEDEEKETPQIVSVDFHAINRCILDSPFFPPNPCILDVCTEDQLILERTQFGELPCVH